MNCTRTLSSAQKVYTKLSFKVDIDMEEPVEEELEAT